MKGFLFLDTYKNMFFILFENGTFSDRIKGGDHIYLEVDGEYKSGFVKKDEESYIFQYENKRKPLEVLHRVKVG